MRDKMKWERNYESFIEENEQEDKLNRGIKK